METETQRQEETVCGNTEGEASCVEAVEGCGRRRIWKDVEKETEVVKEEGCGEGRMSGRKKDVEGE